MYNIPQYNSFFDGRKSDLWNMLMVSEGRNQGYSQYQNQQYEESSYSSYFNGKNDFWYMLVDANNRNESLSYGIPSYANNNQQQQYVNTQLYYQQPNIDNMYYDTHQEEQTDYEYSDHYEQQPFLEPEKPKKPSNYVEDHEEYRIDPEYMRLHPPVHPSKIMKDPNLSDPSTISPVSRTKDNSTEEVQVVKEKEDKNKKINPTILVDAFVRKEEYTQEEVIDESTEPKDLLKSYAEGDKVLKIEERGLIRKNKPVNYNDLRIKEEDIYSDYADNNGRRLRKDEIHGVYTLNIDNEKNYCNYDNIELVDLKKQIAENERIRKQRIKAQKDEYDNQVNIWNKLIGCVSAFKGIPHDEKKMDKHIRESWERMRKEKEERKLHNHVAYIDKLADKQNVDNWRKANAWIKKNIDSYNKDMERMKKNPMSLYDWMHGPGGERKRQVMDEAYKAYKNDFSRLYDKEAFLRYLARDKFRELVRDGFIKGKVCDDGHCEIDFNEFRKSGGLEALKGTVLDPNDLVFTISLPDHIRLERDKRRQAFMNYVKSKSA